MIDAARYEKLGVFYLGQPVSPETGEATPEPFLYDARDLTTHAFCVGMTGSGKTGLCVTLLEEAALDGIPAIVIDPKGDLGNLLLTFPDLRAEDFEPWIDEAAAARSGRSPGEEAAWTADLWKKGLAASGQDGARIGRFRSAVQTALYTPGSRTGRPIRVLGSLDAPSQAVLDDPDALRDRIVGTASSLLTLLDVEADPVKSPAHILLSRLLEDAWRSGPTLTLAELIGRVQNPPFDRVGALDLDSFYPSRERRELAMRLNNLLASPGFEAWMEGEPLEASRLLYTPDGKPRLSILSIAHLSDRERMFFVTLVLGEIVSWMRSQEGTGSLRALLFMDEVFGFFPPLGNPPAKPLMLTLLKQARAYGLGVVLATQNPVDIDYKGLSNCGTWFLGRLQTERDKGRVLEGLEGASSTGFDRARIDRLLSSLGKRVFLMNNVHDDGPALFETRWALSYLRGPLQREEIRRLAPPAEADTPEPGQEEPAARRPSPSLRPSRPATHRPPLPEEAREGFLLPVGTPAPTDARYEAGLFAEASVHYVRRGGTVDHWENVRVYTPLPADLRGSPWGEATETVDDSLAPVGPADVELDAALFEEAPAVVTNPKWYPRWQKMLISHLYREHPLRLWTSPGTKALSHPGETRAEFAARVRLRLREQADAQKERIEKRYRTRIERLHARRQRAEARIEREQSQYENRRMETIISLGSTLLGAVFGRRASTIGRASTAAKNMSRTSRERSDIGRAQAAVEAIDNEIRELDHAFETELDELAIDPRGELALEEVLLRPRKSDLAVTSMRFVWRP